MEQFYWCVGILLSLELVLVMKIERGARHFYLSGARFERLVRIAVEVTGVAWVVGCTGFTFMLLLDAIDLTLLLAKAAPIVLGVAIATLVSGVLMLIVTRRKPVTT